MTTAPAIIRFCLFLGLGLWLGLTPVRAQPANCDFPGQRPILWVELFMGLNVPDRGPVTPKEWDAFLKNTVTPRFPEGFTVYDSYGQWLNEKTKTIVREKSKTIALSVNNDETTKAHIAEVMEAYRRQFHQLSVGITTSHICAAF